MTRVAPGAPGALVAPGAPVAPVALVALVAACACLTGCAGSIVRPDVTPATPRTDALLVLPGFGYGRGGERAIRALAPAMAREGIDLYVPTYVTRSGLDSSRAKLERFLRENRLARYQRLHVFAFIAGAWTLNPLLQDHDLPNLATVVYDRSPFQERAPKIADDRVHFLTWVRYGSTVFDVARRSYAPLDEPGVRVGLIVESKPTAFVRRHEQAARAYGPLAFDCAAFGQRHDDCAFVAMHHEDIYLRFAEVWPELLAFIRSGRFTEAANRVTPPDRWSAKALAERSQR